MSEWTQVTYTTWASISRFRLKRSLLLVLTSEAVKVSGLEVRTLCEKFIYVSR